MKQLILANPGAVVMTKLHDSEFLELIGKDKMFLTVGDAVQASKRKLQEEA